MDKSTTMPVNVPCTRRQTTQKTKSTSSLSALFTDGRAAKRSKEDLAVSSDSEEIESLTDLWDKMRRMMTAENDRIQTNIEAKIEQCTGELRQRIEGLEGQLTTLKEECSSNVSKLNEDIESIRADLQLNLECTEKLERNCELIISGIPYLQGKDLEVLFQNICTTLGFTNVPLAKLFRLSKSPIEPGSTPLILCEFALRNTKNDFYRAYLRNRSLTLRNVGFDNDSRIFMNENLTQHARAIRAEAIKLKKTGALQNVQTRDGIIFVKLTGSTVFTPIQRVDQLPGRRHQTSP